MVYSAPRPAIPSWLIASDTPTISRSESESVSKTLTDMMPIVPESLAPTRRNKHTAKIAAMRALLLYLGGTMNEILAATSYDDVAGYPPVQTTAVYSLPDLAISRDGSYETRKK
ncbi:unnamed protein product [Linum trigynum]